MMKTQLYRITLGVCGMLAVWAGRSYAGGIRDVRAGVQECTVDLDNNTHTCQGISAITFVNGPSNGRAVLKITLDPEETGFTRAVFDITYTSPPTDWTVNIGDSASNNGHGGGFRDQDYCAEMQILDTTMKIHANDFFSPPGGLLHSVPNVIGNGETIRLTVKDEYLGWHSPRAQGELNSEYLYGLAGQPDSGGVNYDIYAGFNRVIAGPGTRIGTGVGSVVVRLSGDVSGLYAGGSNPGVVYKYVGGTSWEPVSDELGLAVLCLCGHEGSLYAGTRSAGGTGEVWRYDGGTTWTLIGDNMDYEVRSLVVFQGKVHAGTVGAGGRLYRYDGGTTWPMVVDHPPWSGFWSLYVWNDILYIGDAGFDLFGHYDGITFTHDADLAGSCIWDHEAYSGELYASAYQGRVHRSADGITWTTIRDFEGLDSWELETFQDDLYVSTGPRLDRYDGVGFTPVWTEPDGHEIISMIECEEALVLGTGAMAWLPLMLETGDKPMGMKERDERQQGGRVYVFDGAEVELISGDGDMGDGIQSLFGGWLYWGEYACCLPQDTWGVNCPANLDPYRFCIEATAIECEELGGFLVTDTPMCNMGAPAWWTCEYGACCPWPGECDDYNGAGMLCEDCLLTEDAKFYGGARCIEDDPCPVCFFDDDEYCIYDEQGLYMVYDDRCSGTGYPRWADDFVAGATGMIEQICWRPCFYDPVAEQECHGNPPVGVDDAWQVAFYDDNNGMPGNIIAGPMILTPYTRALLPGYRCYEYSAMLQQPVPVVQDECYWIEITGSGDCDGCQVYWMSNGDGNLYSMRDSDGSWGAEDVVFILGAGTADYPYDANVDMSFCVDVGLGEPEDCGKIPGACIICGEEGPECNIGDVTHIDCRDPWGPQDDPEGIAFFPGDNCDNGLCIDGVTVCSVSAQDCPPGLEPCLFHLLPPPPENDNCDTDAIPIHTGDPGDLCPLLPCTFEFDNSCATTDGPDPECGTDFGADIWFKFHTQVGECGWISIDTCTNGTYNGIIAFYGAPPVCGAECPEDSSTMQSCGNDTCGIPGGMPCIGDTGAVICPVTTDPIYVCGDDPDWPDLNRWYYIRMGGWSGAYGSGQMTISFEPDPAGCDPDVCPPCSIPPQRPLAEDCSTIGDPLCSDGVTACNVSVPCGNPCPPNLEPCAFTLPGTRCQDDPTVPCTDDGDCNNQSICVPPPADADKGVCNDGATACSVSAQDCPTGLEPCGPMSAVCYAPKTRYLSIKANPHQPPGTARRVVLEEFVGHCKDDPGLVCTVDQDCVDQSAAGPCIFFTELGWVGEPYPSGSDVHGAYTVAQVVDTPYYATYWPDIVHVHTCEIAHASLCEDTGVHCAPNYLPADPNSCAPQDCTHHPYWIQAIAQGQDIADEGNYSEKLELVTNTTWGDTVGPPSAPNVAQPADGLAGLDDIMTAIGYFTGCQDVAPMPWLDIDPSNLAQSPDQIIGLGDIMSCIAGIRAYAYPGDGPLDCPP